VQSHCTTSTLVARVMCFLAYERLAVARVPWTPPVCCRLRRRHLATTLHRYPGTSIIRLSTLLAACGLIVCNAPRIVGLVTSPICSHHHRHLEDPSPGPAKARRTLGRAAAAIPTDCLFCHAVPRFRPGRRPSYRPCAQIAPHNQWRLQRGQRLTRRHPAAEVAPHCASRLSPFEVATELLQSCGCAQEGVGCAAPLQTLFFRRCWPPPVKARGQNGCLAQCEFAAGAW
jgi:hypothetical protein